MDDTGSRRTNIIVLTMLGLAGGTMMIPLIPAGTAVKRNLYPDQESCMRDYAAGQCEATGHGGGGSGSGGSSRSWRGPEYVADRSSTAAGSDPGPGHSGLSTNVETSIRGGFGRVGGFLRAIG